MNVFVIVNECEGIVNDVSVFKNRDDANRHYRLCQCDVIQLTWDIPLKILNELRDKDIELLKDEAAHDKSTYTYMFNTIMQ